VLGIVKAYTPRVGGGPFPGELVDERGEFLRKRGNEFGTVTGRPRRCGWFDAVAVRHAVRLNGAELLALTKLDVLDAMAEIPVCVGYRLRGRVVRDLPSDLEALERAEPVYRTVPGWQRETVGCLEEADLPPRAREYVDLLEQEVGARVALVSTGPRREETILRADPALERLTSGRLAQVLEQRGA
jgi:adenylosuccinate synthase